jgi:hypothetical protein
MLLLNLIDRDRMVVRRLNPGFWNCSVGKLARTIKPSHRIDGYLARLPCNGVMVVKLPWADRYRDRGYPQKLTSGRLWALTTCWKRFPAPWGVDYQRQGALARIDVVFSEQRMPEPKVFISYSHDSQQHKDWVLRLATSLRRVGIDVVFDQSGLVPGQDIAAFMANGIQAADRVVMICSEAYVPRLRPAPVARAMRG